MLYNVMLTVKHTEFTFPPKFGTGNRMQFQINRYNFSPKLYNRMFRSGHGNDILNNLVVAFKSNE